MKYCLVALMLVASLGLSFEAHGAAKSMKDYKSPLVVLPPIEWTGSDPRSREVQQYFSGLSRRGRQEYFRSIINSPKAQAYFHGVMETFDFFFLTYLPRTPESAQHSSDARQCAEDNRNRNWEISGWLRGNRPKKAAAFGVIIEIVFFCEGYAGKGNGVFAPVELVSKREWQDYSAVERKFYVSAYIETVLDSMTFFLAEHLPPPEGRVDSLVQCIADNGVEKIIEKLDEIEVEMQFPMPWTISKAVDSVCAG